MSGDSTMNQGELARLRAQRSGSTANQPATNEPTPRQGGGGQSVEVDISGHGVAVITGLTVIGRAPVVESGGITIALGQDATLSKAHFALNVANGELMAMDLGSANGTAMRTATGTWPLPHQQWVAVDSAAILLAGDTTVRRAGATPPQAAPEADMTVRRPGPSAGSTTPASQATTPTAAAAAAQVSTGAPTQPAAASPASGPISSVPAFTDPGSATAPSEPANDALAIGDIESEGGNPYDGATDTLMAYDDSPNGGKKVLLSAIAAVVGLVLVGVALLVVSRDDAMSEATDDSVPTTEETPVTEPEATAPEPTVAPITAAPTTSEPDDGRLKPDEAESYIDGTFELLFAGAIDESYTRWSPVYRTKISPATYGPKIDSGWAWRDAWTSVDASNCEEVDRTDDTIEFICDVELIGLPTRADENADFVFPDPRKAQMRWRFTNPADLIFLDDFSTIS